MRNKKIRFDIRKRRVRNRLSEDRFRLSIFKSNKHIYAQIIDDKQGITLTSASTLDKDIRRLNKSNCNKELAMKVGSVLAAKAVALGINKVVFDKGGYKYHGVVKELADSARKELNF